MLKAGKPEALKVTVGTTVVPQIGPAGKVTTVSLLPADLLKAPAAAAPPPAPQPAANSPPADRGRVRAALRRAACAGAGNSTSHQRPIGFIGGQGAAAQSWGRNRSVGKLS